MKYCTGCGAQLEETAKFCSVCGQKAEVQTQTQAQPETQAPPTQDNDGGFQSKIDNAVNAFKETANTTADYAPEDIASNKVMAVLAYLGILFIVPLVAAPNSPYAKFHANQGLLLFLLNIATGVLTIIPFVGWIAAAIGTVASIVFFILGIVNAVKGQAKELPIIGKYRIIK